MLEVRCCPQEHKKAYREHTDANTLESWWWCIDCQYFYKEEDLIECLDS